MVSVAVSPSPVAVTTTVDEPAAARCAAVSVSSTSLALALEAAVSGFADHAAVTPSGRPLTLKFTLPVNDPPSQYPREAGIDRRKLDSRNKHNHYNYGSIR